VLNPKDELKDTIPIEDKKLGDIFKIELVKDKSPAEIQSIWQDYHKDKEVISAIIQQEQYLALNKNMKNFPTFLFPLPRSQGYEFIMCQSYGKTVHFTPLLAYQVSHSLYLCWL
jgi:ATP synthase mitochondrial F1 complex assembly factor 1